MLEKQSCLRFVIAGNKYSMRLDCFFFFLRLMNHYHYHYHYEILDYFTSTRRKLHSCSWKIRSSVAYSQITNIIFPRVKTELYESPSPFSAMSDYNNKKKKKKRNKSGPSVDVLCVALAWYLDQYTTMSSISNRLITIWITDERSN